jgi:hypothetical protein
MATIRPNRVKQRLSAGETVVSLGGGLDNPDLIDLVGPLGLDAIWLEGEHGPVDYGRVGDLTRACDLWGMTSIVRVNALDYGNIYRMLDLGAQGICVPHIDTADHARAFVEAAKFAPIGKRGLFTSRQGYGVPDYLEVANDHTLLIALIEDIKAVENLDAILEGRPHRRLLRSTLGPRGVDGPDRRARACRGAAGPRGDAQAHRRCRPHRRHDPRRQPQPEHYTAMGVRFIAAFLQPWLAAGAESLLASIAGKG